LRGGGGNCPLLLLCGSATGAIQGQIMLMNPLPDAAKAYASVMQEEKQRSLRSIHEILDNSAMAVRKAESVALCC